MSLTAPGRPAGGGPAPAPYYGPTYAPVAPAYPAYSYGYAPVYPAATVVYSSGPRYYGHRHRYSHHDGYRYYR